MSEERAIARFEQLRELYQREQAGQATISAEVWRHG